MGFIIKNNYDGNFLVLCPGFIFNKSNVAFLFSRFFFTAESNFSTRQKCKFAHWVQATYFVFPIIYKGDPCQALKRLDKIEPDSPPTCVLDSYTKPYFNIVFKAPDFVDPKLS